MSETLEFSVIIVNFNGGDLVQKAVDSLKAQTYRNFEVFVVDNASSDGSLAQLNTDDLPSVHILAEPENHGFAKANNLAAHKAMGQWLVMLNPDAIARPDWLQQIYKGIQSFPDVSMFASAQFNADAPSLMDGAGDNYHVFGIPWRGGYGRAASEMPETGEVFSPCGAGSVFRRQTFLDCGGFDESFFCYCEDVDIGFRLRLLGERCVFLRSAEIMHAGSAISNTISDFALFHGTRNRVWVFLQNMPPLAFGLMLAPHVASTLYIYLRRGREKVFRQAVKAAFDGWSEAWARRRKVQKTRRLSSWDILKSMTWNPRLLSQRMTDVRPFRTDTHKRG